MGTIKVAASPGSMIGVAGRTTNGLDGTCLTKNIKAARTARAIRRVMVVGFRLAAVDTDGVKVGEDAEDG